MMAIYRQFLAVVSALFVISGGSFAPSALAAEWEFKSARSECDALTGPRLLDLKSGEVKRTIGIVVQKQTGELQLLTGHYVHSSHEWLADKAKESASGLKVLWGGEMEWMKSTEGPLVLTTWNETSGYVFELFSQLPEEEVQRRYSLTEEFLKNHTAFDGSTAQRISFSEKNLHLSEDLNNLVSLIKKRAVRHDVNNVLASFLAYVQNLLMIRQKDRSGDLPLLFSSERDDSYTAINNKMQAVLEWIVNECAGTLSEQDLVDLREMGEYLKQSPRGAKFFYHLYEDPEMVQKLTDLTWVITSHVNGENGLRKVGYQIID